MRHYRLKKLEFVSFCDLSLEKKTYQFWLASKTLRGRINYISTEGDILVNLKTITLGSIIRSPLYRAAEIELKHVIDNGVEERTGFNAVIIPLFPASQVSTPSQVAA